MGSLARPLTGDVVFSAPCEASVQLGDVVYALADGSVALVDTADELKVAVAGVVTGKPTPTTCWVQSGGLLNAAALFPSPLQPGPQWVDASGRPSAMRPHGAPTAVRWLIRLGSVVATGRLLLNITAPVGVRT